MPAPGGSTSRGGHTVSSSKPKAKPNPQKSLVFGPIGNQAKPFAPQRKAQQRQTQRAQAKLPLRSLPNIPVIRNPTPAQERATRAAIARIPHTALPEIRQDPRHAGLQRAIQAQINRDERRLAGGTARQAGGVNGLTNKQQIEFGRQLLAAFPRSVAKPGHHTRVGFGGLATIDLTAAARSIKGLPGFSQGDLGPRNLVRHTFGDIKTLIEAPAVIGFAGADAAYTAARHGDTRKASALGTGLVKSVTESSPAALLTGHPTLAVKRFGQHPVIEALNYGALTSIGGRLAGAGARAVGSTVSSTGARGVLARAGSTLRPAVAHTTDAGAVKAGAYTARRYSKDSTRKASQRASDALRYEPLKDAAGRQVHVTEGGHKIPVVVRVAKDGGEQAGSQVKAQQSRADVRASRANAINVAARQEADKTFRQLARQTKVKGKNAQTAAAMVTSGTIRTARTMRQDLLAGADRIEQFIRANPGRYRHKAEMRTALENVRSLREMANDPKVVRQAEKIYQLGLSFGKELNKQDTRLRDLGFAPAGQLERARLSEAALAHMGASHQDGALKLPGGVELPNHVIRNALQAAGRDPSTVAYLPHMEGLIGGKAFYKQFRPGTRPNAGKTRTGELYRKGATTTSRELVREELTDKATTAAKIQQLDKYVSEAGVKHPSGRHYTAKEANEIADRLKRDTGEDWVPVRASGTSPETRAITEARTNPNRMETLHHSLLNDRVADIGSGAKNVVLVPGHEFNRLIKHLTPAGEGKRLVQMMNGAFRLAVLPQPRWLTGNFIEPYLIRLPLKGSGLVNIPGLAVDVAVARRVVKHMEKSGDPRLREAAKELRAQHFGGLFVGRRGASVHRSYENFSGATRKTLFAGHVLRNIPAVKQLGDMAIGLANGFFALNRVLESTAQRAAFGKSVREDIQAFSGSWLKTVVTTNKLIDEIAHNAVSTATQERWLREQHHLLGQYEAFSPNMRNATQTVAPFLPWVLNSARFAFWTMPAEHTIATAAILNAGNKYMDDWRKAHAGLPPGSLRLAQMTKQGGLVDFARYSPYGLTGPIAEGDLGGAVDALLPQIQGTIAAFQGKDPFGRDLKVKPGPGNPTGKPTQAQQLGIAGNTALETVLPFLALGRRLREGGGTGYANSTIVSPKTKPGSKHMSGPRRALDPFRPTYLTGGPVNPSSGGAPVRRKRTVQDELYDVADQINGTVSTGTQDELYKLADEINAGRR